MLLIDLIWCHWIVALVIDKSELYNYQSLTPKISILKIDFYTSLRGKPIFKKKKRKKRSILSKDGGSFL